MSSIPSVVFLPPSFVTGQLTLQQAPPHRALCDVDKPNNPTKLHTFVNFWPFFAHETVTVIPSKLELAWKSKKRLRGGFEGSFIPRFFAGEGRKAKVAASRVSETLPRPNEGGVVVVVAKAQREHERACPISGKGEEEEKGGGTSHHHRSRRRRTTDGLTAMAE